MKRRIAAGFLILVLMGSAIIALAEEPNRTPEYRIDGNVLYSLDGNAKIYNETKTWVCKNITVYLLRAPATINVDIATTDYGENHPEEQYDRFSFVPEDQRGWADGDEGIAVGEFFSENLNYVFITNFTLKTILGTKVGLCANTEWEPVPTPIVYKKGDNWINISIPKFTNPKTAGLGIAPNSNNTIGYRVWRGDILGREAGIANYSNETHFFFNDTSDISPDRIYNYSVAPIARGNYNLYAQSLKLSTEELAIKIESPLTPACYTGGSVQKIVYNLTGGAPPFNITFSYFTATEKKEIATTVSYTRGEQSYGLTIPKINATHVKLNISMTDASGKTKWSVIPPELEYFVFDSKKPVISSVVPIPNASEVSIFEDIVIEFDEPMNKASVEGDFSITPSVPNLTFNWVTDSKAIISHDPFQRNVTYNCSLSAESKDLSNPGNGLVPYSWSFKTTPFISLSLHFPYSGARLTGGVTQLLRYTVDGGMAPYNIAIRFYNGTAWSYVANLTNISKNHNTYSWSSPALDIVNAKLEFNVTDVQGLTAVVTREFSLDSTAPELLEYTGSKGYAVITESFLLLFSESMNITSVEQNFILVDNETNTKVNGTWKWDTTTAIFTPVAPLIPNMSYTARITNEALDISVPGNRFVEKVWYFTALEGRGDFTVSVSFPTLPRKGDVGEITVSLFNTGGRGFNSSGTIIIKFYRRADGFVWTEIARKTIPGIWFGGNETRSIEVKFETAGDYYFKVEIDSTSALDIFNDRDYFVETAFIRVEEVPPMPLLPYALIALMVLIVVVIAFLVLAGLKKEKKPPEEK